MPNVNDLLDLVAAPLLNEQAAVAVTYTERGGADQAVLAIVGAEQTERLETDAGIVHRRTREISLPRTAAAAGAAAAIAAVSMLATITYGSRTYTIDGVVSQSDSWTTLRCVRPEVAEHTRQGYRRK